MTTTVAPPDPGGTAPPLDGPQAPPSELRRAGVTGLVALVALNVADVVLTRLVLARGGVELNPLADALLAANSALLVKLAIVVALFVRFLRRGPDLPTVCLLWLVTGIYMCVVVLNGSVLLSS